MTTLLRSRTPSSLADFGDQDTAEAEIESGAPLEVPEVPPIPQLAAHASNGNLAAAAVPQADAAARYNDGAADSEA